MVIAWWCSWVVWTARGKGGGKLVWQVRENARYFGRFIYSPHDLLVVSVRPLGMRLFLELQGLRRAGLTSAGCFRAIKRASEYRWKEGGLLQCCFLRMSGLLLAVDIFFRAAPLLSSLVDIWLLEDMLLHRDIPYINKAVSDTLMVCFSNTRCRSLFIHSVFFLHPMYAEHWTIWRYAIASRCFVFNGNGLLLDQWRGYVLVEG